MKVWRVAIEPLAAKELRRLPSADRDRVMRYLQTRVATSEDPRRIGHALTGQFKGLWSYRVGDFRLIASIRDEIVTVLIVRVGNRREIYR